jgi:hypothetical protein
MAGLEGIMRIAPLARPGYGAIGLIGAGAFVALAAAPASAMENTIYVFCLGRHFGARAIPSSVRC